MTGPTGRRRADARPEAAESRRPDPTTPPDALPTGAMQRSPRSGQDSSRSGQDGYRTGPDSDASMTMPRQSRAERRREGLLPPGDDPMLRRPPARPGAPAPAVGRRRSDLDAIAAPGDRPAVDADRPPAPRPTPPVSGPMTSAAPRPSAPRPAAPPPAAPAPAPATSVTGRPTTPPIGRGPVGDPPRATPFGRRDAGAADAAPFTTGMPSWAAEPSPPAALPHDMTQRVSGSAPAESAWGASVAATPKPTPQAGLRTPQSGGLPVSAEPSGGPQAPARPVRGAVPSSPALLAQERSGAVRPVEDRPEAVAGPPSAPPRRAVDIPVGGRAALRLERQAAETARKKTGGRRGPDTTAPPRGPEPDAVAGEESRSPRRLVQGLLAVVVIALVVLGVWSFTSPGTTETAAQTPAPSSAPAAVPSTPVQESVVPTPEITPVPVGPVRAPITVLNSTRITGLAAAIGEQLTGGGWEVTGTGASPVSDVATTTVYFSEGDTEQQQAATQLVEQFPDVSGPVARYFDVPDVADPGLVVVATGNWQP